MKLYKKHGYKKTYIDSKNERRFKQKMDKKKLSLINKIYNSLYDLNSRYNLFKEQMDYIEGCMLEVGYKVKINSFDKCVFVKILK